MDVALLEQRIAELTREADPMSQGIAVQSATVNVDVDLASDCSIASGLVYTINRFCTSKGSNFTLQSLSTSISALAREVIEATNSFKSITTSANFDIAFQPILSVQTGATHHYEVLARFPSVSDQSTVYEQIALAEHTGLIIDFDLAMVRKVVAWLKRITSFNANASITVAIFA